MTLLRWVSFFALPAVLLAQEPGRPGTKLAPSTLQNLSGSPVTVDTHGKVTVVMFMSVQCPVSNAYNERMQKLYQDYKGKGVQFYFVNANDSESAPAVAAHASEHRFGFPIFKDGNNRLADQLNAQVTPEAYLLDGQGTILYHGSIDDARNESRVTKQPLRTALDEALAGKAVSVSESKAFGCSIKRAKRS